MKIKKLFITLLALGCVTAVGVSAATINQTVARINADANKPGGPEQVLKSISASTHVPVATLEKEKAKSGLNYGDLYAAHAIASASGKSFADIAAMKAKGQTWDQVADANGVSLGGKKQQKTVAAAKPTPTPPMKTLRQEQAERYNGTFQRTNEPKPVPSKP
jgi:hypothetical protein